jgi:PAS domain S-box-containing protein/diguanylate cyclase (GGDEF)-like protein
MNLTVDAEIERAVAQAAPHGDLTPVVLQALQQAPAPMVLTDGRGVILRVNTAFETATGFSADELEGQRPSMLASGLQGPAFYRGMWQALLRDGRWQGDVWNKRKDGRVYQECLGIVALRVPGADEPFYLGTYTGLTSPLALRQKMVLHGDTDPTTGLLSRSALLGALEHIHDQGAPVHVLVLDIDGFTVLNEQFGLAGGDAILRQMAVRCTQVAASHTSSSVVGRVGPDEFAIGLVVPAEHRAGHHSADWIQQFADRLRAALAPPFELSGGRKTRISATIGSASSVPAGAPGSGAAAETLLHASFARQQAVPGDGALQKYETQARQRQLGPRLHEAVQKNEIAVAYQPKVNLTTGALAGVEALARWRLPDGTAVAPSEFIPLAERLGLIGRLGECVLNQVLADLAHWGRDGLAQPVVAVNFSALQFHGADPAQDLADTISRYGVPPELIEVELTESLLIGEMEVVMQSLQAMRHLGVRLSIDDFGTGYSSLAYLRRFPIQYLKIDRQFVTDMVQDRSACEIVRVIVELAHRLGLRCIAEGIETVEQLALLRAMGCDEGQGYLLAKPMDGAALTALLAGRCPWLTLFAAALPQAEGSSERCFADMDQAPGAKRCAH